MLEYLLERFLYRVSIHPLGRQHFCPLFSLPETGMRKSPLHADRGQAAFRPDRRIPRAMRLRR
jgi:hypothetical protein